MNATLYKAFTYDQNVKEAMKEVHHPKNYKRLFKAIIAQSYKLVRVLVEGGLDVNSSFDSGLTPLMVACSTLRDECDDETTVNIIRFLISKGADPFRLDKWQKNCIAYARSYNRAGIIAVKRILLDEGIITQKPDESEPSSPRLTRLL